jgi:hypothetical protein
VSSHDPPRFCGGGLASRTEGDLLVAYKDHLALWRVGQEGERTVRRSLLRLAAGARSSSFALVVTGDAVWSVQATGAGQKLASDPVAPRAVASDRLRRVWGAGDPPFLGRVEQGAVSPLSRHLGDVSDLFFGHQGLFSGQNAYLAERMGGSSTCTWTIFRRTERMVVDSRARGQGRTASSAYQPHDACVPNGESRAHFGEFDCD